jgi:hypothetical protein
LRAQQSNVELHPVADSLSNLLVQNPTNEALQLQLINFYLNNLQPELALLEISNAEARNALSHSLLGLKGKVQMLLEQIDPALRSLENAYVLSPSDETILDVAILEYARQHNRSGLQYLSRLKYRMPGLSSRLFRLYEQYYLNNKRLIARAVVNALQDFDPAAYAQFFPKPEVTILSPAEQSSTEAQQVSVIFEVRHSKAIRSIRIADQTLYERKEAPGASQAEPFKNTYTPMVTLGVGKNVIEVIATDAYGYETSRSISINRLSFDRPVTWRSPFSDSLKQGFQFLRGYYPENELKAPKSNLHRALVISGSYMYDSTEYFDRGLFVYDFLTHAYGGYAEISNAKVALGSRAVASNILLVIEEWLIKGATFQSVSTMYLNGIWEINDSQWNYLDVAGTRVNLKPIFERLARVASAGINVIIDGSIDRRELFEDGLRQLVKGSSIPLTVLILPKLWQQTLLQRLTVPPSFTDRPEDFAISCGDIAKWTYPSVNITKEGTSVAFAQNPALKIGKTHGQALLRFELRLGNESLTPAQKETMMSFARDWKHYPDIMLFLDNKISVESFRGRAEEFLSRTTKRPQ